MTTLDKAPRPGAGNRPAAINPAHDPTVPFYAVGGADPDFALPPRGDSRTGGFWSRLLAPHRRK